MPALATSMEDRMAALFSASASQSTSEKIYKIDALASEIFRLAPADYQTVIRSLEKHWSQNPQLALTALSVFQTNWERQFSAQYWREKRLGEASSRYIPLLTAIHLLDQSLEKKQENALRLSKEMFAQPMTSVSHPAPIAILANLPEISRWTPLSLDEILTEEQLQRTQSQLEALGVTSAAGLFLLRNKTVIQGATKAASRNPFKITPVGILATGLILGAADGLYAWSNYQSLEQLESEVVKAEKALRQARASGLQQEILIANLTAATKNYALKLILPIYQNNLSTETQLVERTQTADEDRIQQQLTSDLKIRYLKAKLEGDSATIEELSSSDDVGFYNWRFDIEGHLSNGRLIYLPSSDADPEIETRKYWAELLENEEMYRESLDHYYDLRITRLEEKMLAKQRTQTYKTLFKSRGFSCSYEYFRNQWLTQLTQTQSSQPHLEEIVRYYYGFYSSPLKDEPFEQWLSQYLSPAYDPGVLGLNQSQPLNTLFNQQWASLKPLAHASILRTQAHWNEEFSTGSPCAQPLALLEQTLQSLKRQGPQGAPAVQELLRFSQGIQSLLRF